MVVTEHSGLFRNENRSDDYDIFINGRVLVALKMNVTWEFEQRVCYYVGNVQGGPLSIAEAISDSVIEGEYTDYRVNSLFDPILHDSSFGQFNEELCDTSTIETPN